MRKTDLIKRHLLDFSTISEPEALEQYDIKNLEGLARKVRIEGYRVAKRIEIKNNHYDEKVKVYHFDLVAKTLK